MASSALRTRLFLPSGLCLLTCALLTCALLARDVVRDVVITPRQDVGFATRGHTPHGRGYAESLGKRLNLKFFVHKSST